MEDMAINEQTLADLARLRQIEIELAEIRQRYARFGVSVNTPHCELRDAGGLIMSATRKIRLLTDSRAADRPATLGRY